MAKKMKLDQAKRIMDDHFLGMGLAKGYFGTDLQDTKIRSLRIPFSAQTLIRAKKDGFFLVFIPRISVLWIKEKYSVCFDELYDVNWDSLMDVEEGEPNWCLISRHPVVNKGKIDEIRRLLSSFQSRQRALSLREAVYLAVAFYLERREYWLNGYYTLVHPINENLVLGQYDRGLIVRSLYQRIESSTSIITAINPHV